MSRKAAAPRSLRPDVPLFPAGCSQGRRRWRAALHGECGITVGATHYVASVETGGCHYSLGVREDVASPYAGTWGVACEEPGEGIEFKAFIAGKFRNA